MFRGVVPVDLLSEVTTCVDFRSWRAAYVCCSGTFRFETILRTLHPKLPVIGNDVSLYSCALGSLATNQPIPITFTGRLDFMEQALGDSAPFLDRVAAVVVALDLAQYKGSNDFARHHFDHFVAHFPDLLARARKKLEHIVGLKLDGYFAGDWREHVEHAIEQDCGIVAFPPFFRGDYESLFKFLHQNTDWNAPSYQLYDPATLHEIVDRIASAGVPWCVLSDQKLDGHRYFLKYIAGRKVPHYCYGTARAQRLIRKPASSAQPFPYKAFDPAQARKNSVVRWEKADGKQAAHIKNVFLSHNIVHTGGLFEAFIYIDDMLAGVVAFNLSKTRYKNKNTLYLLCDVSTSTEGKTSKMIARMGLSRELVRQMELKMLNRFEFVCTTARTVRPASMKYRGIYEKLSIRPDAEGSSMNVIQYGADVLDDTLQGVYQWWWSKYGKQYVQQQKQQGGVS
jgi:hypothetical protein